MHFREFVDSVQSIIAVAELVKKDSKDGTAPMADFLYALKNAGISMDYDKFKSVYDSNAQLKNAIQQFDAETVTFVGGEPQADAPAGDIPPDEKVGQMANRAMNKREDVNEEDDMDRDMSAEEEQFVDMVVDYYKGDMEDAYSIAGDVPRGTSSRRADYLHKEITSRLGIKEMNEDKSLKAKIDRLEDQNQHGQVALELAKAYGTELEVNLINAINAVHQERGSIEIEERDLRDSISSKYYKKMMSMESSFGDNSMAARGIGINILNTMEQIVDQKGAAEVKFLDGKSKVDMYTASAFMQVYNKVNEANQKKMLKMAETRTGFVSLMKKVFNMISGVKEGKSPHKKGTAKYKKHMAAMHAGESVIEAWQTFKEGKMSPEDELAMLKANVKNPAQSDEAKEKMKARIKELEEMIKKEEVELDEAKYVVVAKVDGKLEKITKPLDKKQAEMTAKRLQKDMDIGIGKYKFASDIKIQKEEVELDERSLTKAEKSKMRSYEKKIDKKDFIKRYGEKEGPGAYYGTVTKMAKKNA